MKRTSLTVYRERALLVGVLQNGSKTRPEEALEELGQLAKAAGAVVQEAVIQRREEFNPAFYVGKGKAQELADHCRGGKIDVVIFDNDLSPAQVRNLEKLCDRKVIDRTELILDIFSTHARTHQSKLQVELAQLEYTLPRLKHLWSHLERLAGGVGIGTRGPGEKQIEVDRRIARKRINDLRKDLKQIEERKRRTVASRHEDFNLSLVGYTNAGKSSLMNALTGTDVLVQDKVFSTLDTKTHIWRLENAHKVLLSDTVGFIRNLPHHLVASFQATLQEVKQANLLIHVADASHPELETQIEAVEAVLREIECSRKPAVLVLNKADALRDPVELHVLRKRWPDAILVSALTGEGLDALDRAVARFIEERMMVADVLCPAGDGRIQAYLSNAAQVLATQVEGEVIRLRVRITQRALDRMWKETGRTPGEIPVHVTTEPVEG